MPPGTGQVSCGGAQYIIAVGLGVFSKAAEGPAFMPDGGSIQVIDETTQFDDVVQDANVRRQQKGHATDLARSQCRGRTALEILQTETVSGIGALPNLIFCGGATVQRSLSERSRRTATRHPNRFPLDGLISKLLLSWRLGGRHGTQEARGSSEHPGFVAPGGLCIGSHAGALFNRTVVRHAPEWVRAAESNPTLADLCRSNGRSWR